MVKAEYGRKNLETFVDVSASYRLPRKKITFQKIAFVINTKENSEILP